MTFLAARLPRALFTIFIILVMNFFLFRLLPGASSGRILASNPKISAETRAQLMKTFGLDKPLGVQFLTYLANTARGQLGISFSHKRPVTEVIGERVGPTLLLVGVAEVLAIGLGIFLGALAAWRRGTWLDLSAVSFSLVMYAVPTFWLGILVISVFAVGLRGFPTFGMLVPGEAHATTWLYLQDLLSHLFLPALTLSLVLLGGYLLIMKESLGGVLAEDYVTTARAKGLTDGVILRRHALPNAMLPMITLIALNVGFLMGGAIEVETVFSWPGLGRLMFEALQARDFPVLQGLFLIITVMVVLANLLADWLYTVLDPRVKA